MWNYKEVEDEFLGEVLLDLGEARIDNTPTCYHLEDHDENSSPLPYRYATGFKFNTFQANGFFHKATCNKVRLVYCIY